VKMRDAVRLAGVPMLMVAVLTAGCQSPTENPSIDVNDFLEVSATPNPTNAVQTASGRTYRVVRGNNQPDEILPFDWETNFGLSINLNNNITNDDLDVDFPVTLSSATVKVQQASGGIVSPPTGGEVEHWESVTSQVSSNQFHGPNQPVTMVFDIYYDLPNLRKEALVSVTLSFTSDNGKAFTKVVDVKVNP
jgi:hypothetical protein